MDYSVVVVDVEGTPYGTLANAKVGSVSWELNGIGAADFTLATTDDDADIAQPGREVQIYYSGNLVWWGVIIRPQAGMLETTWQCVGLLWYFGHRFMGRADRVNQLVNGDFEDGETGWFFVNDVTHSVGTGTFYEPAVGGHSLEMEGGGARHNQYAGQGYIHTQYHPLGDILTLSAYVFVPSADYLGGAVANWGIVLIRRNADGVLQDEAFETIDDSTLKDEWVHLEVSVFGNKQDDEIEVRLYPPYGRAYYDLVTLTLMESLSFGQQDVATIIKGIVDYAQDNGPFVHGKSDLNIAADDSVPTGVVESVAYQFAEHRNILDAILEFVRRGIIDIDIEITETTRTFTTYYPSKGTTYATTLSLDDNLAGFSYSWDGETAATNVVMLGPGDGPDRPEGGATDTSLFDSGLTLEIVEQAPDDATVGQLDARAAERLAVAVRPEILEVTTLPDTGIIGDLKVGDRVPVFITHGWVDINADYRVVRISANLLTDQATITLNADHMTSAIFPPDVRRQVADLAKRVGVLERRRSNKDPAPKQSSVDEPFMLNLDIEAESLMGDTSFHSPAPTFSSAGGEFGDLGYSAQGTLTVGPLEIAASSDDPEGRIRASLRCGLGCRATREPWSYSAHLIVSNADCTERLEAKVDDVDIGAIETDDGTIDLPVEASWDVTTTGGELFFDYSIGTVIVQSTTAGIYWVTFAVTFHST